MMSVIKEAVEGLERGLESSHPAIKRATENIVETFNTLALPLTILNHWRIAVRKYGQQQFQQEFDKKMAGIPPEYQQDAKPNIVRQAAEGIADTLDQPALKEAYLNTLVKAFDSRNDDSLYPAYLNIIQQLGSQGLALFIQFVAKYQQINPAYPPIYHAEKGVINFSHLVFSPDILPIPKKSMLENWVRLGLITLTPKLEKNQVASSGWATHIVNELNKLPHQSLILSEVRLTEFALDFIETVDG